MKLFKLILVMTFLTIAFSSVIAAEGFMATKDHIANLKNDIRLGKIQVGITRLKGIREKYGDAKSIKDAGKKVTYDYGGLKIEFDRIRYWRKWSYDGFKKAAYSDKIDSLRFDLESEEIVGENIPLSKILKDYEEPTEKAETDADGALSIYYYGDIKMVFENVITVRSWQAKNLEVDKSDGILGGK